MSGQAIQIYGVVIATAGAVWNFIKWKKDRAHITLSCYLAKRVNNTVLPSGARLDDGTSEAQDQQRCRFIAYNVRNLGGTPITVQSLASEDKDGQLKIVCGKSLNLPQIIERGASVTILVPLDGTEGTIRRFYVSDAMGRKWRCKARIFQKQLAEYRQTVARYG